MRKSLWLFCSLFFLGNRVNALQTFPLVDHHKIDIPISRDQQNRIAVFGDRIKQIFGTEGAFDVQSDDERGQIFVRLLNPATSKPLTLTIVTESGLTQDLNLIPGSRAFQSVLLKPASMPESQASLPLSRMQRLIRLLAAMALGERVEGYTVSTLKQWDRVYPEPLTLVPQMFYQGQESQLEGRVYLLKNEGKDPLTLTEAVLALPKDLALSLSKTSLLPGEEALLFVISSVGGQP